ncbi:MAG: polysaccharide deacetylase family protein [Oscillospiraceae bacterium]|nr:polysaccharide deacetylase family protein [Oscillospiraceae bacterium]
MAKLCALSFDDGPSPRETTATLDVLERHGVRASFFLIGKNITPETGYLIDRGLAMGCEYEDHSLTHSFMSKMDKAQIEAEIAETDRRIIEATGRMPRFFRPPYIDYNDLMFDTIDKVFICGKGSADWEDTTTSEQICQRAYESAEDGSIFLLHDTKGNMRTSAGVDMLIPKLKADGYEFVTVAELYDIKGVVPEKHKIYSEF